MLTLGALSDATAWGGGGEGGFRHYGTLDLISFSCWWCIPLGHVCMSLGHVCMSLGHVCMPLGHVCMSLGHVCMPLGHVCMSLGHVKYHQLLNAFS